jgi:hypothetical protein
MVQRGRPALLSFRDQDSAANFTANSPQIAHRRIQGPGAESPTSARRGTPGEELFAASPLTHSALRLTAHAPPFDLQAPRAARPARPARAGPLLAARVRQTTRCSVRACPVHLKRASQPSTLDAAIFVLNDGPLFDFDHGDALRHGKFARARLAWRMGQSLTARSNSAPLSPMPRLPHKGGHVNGATHGWTWRRE